MSNKPQNKCAVPKKKGQVSPLVVAVCGSLLIHFLVFYLYGPFLGRYDHLGRGVEQVPIPLEIYSYEREEGALSSTTSKGAVSKKYLKGTDSIGDFSLRDLMPEKSHVGQQASPNSQTGSGKSDEFWEFQKSLDLENSAGFQKFFASLWRKINTQISYPEDFARERIEGTVTVRLVLKKNGMIADNSLEAVGDNSQLELYVAVVLAAIFQTPLNERSWSLRERTPVVLVFRFQTHAGKSHLAQEQGGFVNNVLSFQKNAYVPGKVNEAIHKFFTKFVPPIIPGPGFIIDFVHLYEMVQAWTSPDEGQMRRYRLEALREHLRYEKDKASDRSRPDNLQIGN